MTLGPLTERETAVVMLLTDGHGGESIANQLDISVETVKRHIVHICRKLCVNSRMEITVWYYKTYWTPKSTDKELIANLPEIEQVIKKLRVLTSYV